MQGMVVDWVGYHAGNTPDKVAIMELPTRRTQTYLELNDRIGRIADWLSSLGISRGDRVGMLAPNSTDNVEIMFATWRIGGIFLALNFRLTATELNYIIQDSEPKVLVYDIQLHQTIKDLAVKVKHVISTTGTGGSSQFEMAIMNRRSISEMVELEPDDRCILMYTSGTTGRPKGVNITHGMMLWSIVSSSAALYYDKDMVAFAVMPLFHIGGLQTYTCPAIHAGGTAVIMRSFDAGAMLEAIDASDLAVTHFMGVPAIYNALRDHANVSTTDFSRLKVCSVGAETAPTSLIYWWCERGVVLQEGYGMTEMTGLCCVLDRKDVPARIGSVGKPSRHMQIKIVKSDMIEAASGETGEIWCRGPAVTQGYWNRPEADEKSFVDGWLLTGDVGLIDEDGFVYIQERLKDMYISGGENVYPKEIENVLYEIEGIREVALIGLPDERWGETGCAVVVLHEGANVTEEAIISFCRPKLARFKQPSKIVFVSELPRNATGKVLKHELRRTLAV